MEARRREERRGGQKNRQKKKKKKRNVICFRVERVRRGGKGKRKTARHTRAHIHTWFCHATFFFFQLQGRSLSQGFIPPPLSLWCLSCNFHRLVRGSSSASTISSISTNFANNVFTLSLLSPLAGGNSSPSLQKCSKVSSAGIKATFIEKFGKKMIAPPIARPKPRNQNKR